MLRSENVALGGGRLNLWINGDDPDSWPRSEPAMAAEKGFEKEEKISLGGSSCGLPPSKFGDIIQVLFDKRLVSVINSLTCNMISDMIQRRLEGQIVENTSRLGR